MADGSVLIQFKDLGFVAVLAFAAIGSALGTGAAGMAAIGAWKKCFAQSKEAPFILTAFVGAPLSQTIYGLIVMRTLAAKADGGSYLWAAGVLGGLAIGMSAWMQGKAGAGACDALAETGEGFGKYIMVLGVIETVALFVMIFIMLTVGNM
ncbi:MAG: V-type ATP synthase subunit K [Candidatus Omnitrophica bacterium]|nr:V-type ATP synthase subunit K [Candidatus Omnitrophota bacterium]MCK4422466.1 V-type ATP synthase subunit K [Candidatus Omnitrophota bacterium]